MNIQEEPLLIDKTIKKMEFLFRCVGINIKSGKKTRADTIRNRFVYILNFLWLNIDLAGAVVWFFTGISNSKSFTELTYVSPCITLSFLGNLKSLYMIFRESNVDKLIDVLKNMEVEERAREKDEEKDKIIKTEHDFVTTVITVLNVFYFVLVVAFALSPVTLVALKYFTTKEVELLLPFLIVYPFDAYDLRYWPWVYLRQIWSEVIVVIDICAADYMFYTFCTYIRMQFCLLKYNIEKMIPADADRNNEHDNEKIRNQFALLIKWHQDLISSANMLESVYTRPTLLNFVSSSVLICLTGFNVVSSPVAVVEARQRTTLHLPASRLHDDNSPALRVLIYLAISDVAFVVTFLSFLFMSLLQIFFLCFFGDLLMASSMEVSDAVYNCRWYLADTSLGKDLLLVQTRAQTPCKLTASNFSEVNLKAFMKILSTAWSYFALLQTLYGAPT